MNGNRNNNKKPAVIRKKNVLLDFYLLNYGEVLYGFRLLEHINRIVICDSCVLWKKKEEKLYIFNTCPMSYVYIFPLFKFKNRLNERTKKKIIKLISENVKFCSDNNKIHIEGEWERKGREWKREWERVWVKNRGRKEKNDKALEPHNIFILYNSITERQRTQLWHYYSISCRVLKLTSLGCA